MGVLSLHNECPPTNYGADDAGEVCRGLVIGEEGTSSMLKALSDCLITLATMDDTVGYTVSAWESYMGGRLAEATEKSLQAKQSFDRAFEALNGTLQRIE